MPKRLPIILVLLLILAGCGGRVNAPNFASELQQWLGAQQYSVWAATWDRSRPTPKAVDPISGVIPNGNLAPESAQGPEPRRPDGLTLGNRHIFAAIGCADWDVSQISHIYGDRKSFRALSGPLTFALQSGEQAEPLSRAPKQRLQRVLQTSISVATQSTAGATVTFVDFAPLKPELNALVRLVTVRNEADARDLTLVMSGRLGDLAQKNSTTISAASMAILSDHALEAKEGDVGQEVRIALGSIGKGESRSVALYFVPAQNEAARDRYIGGVRKVPDKPMALLQGTLTAWQQWRAKAKVPLAKAGASNEERHLYDLMDGILCMIRSHVGFDAIHTGSLRYPHTRAWVRDNYWVQRALLEAGLREEARLNLDFFFDGWKKSGLASYYETATRRGHGYGEIHVELPHYLVLMVKDAEKLGGIDPKPYWPMVKGCLDQARVGENGLQPINGDETWLLAAGVNQLDYMLDNSILLIASAKYGADLAKRVGDGKSAGKYAGMERKAKDALRSRVLPSPAFASFAIAFSGTRTNQADPFPNAGVLARPTIFGAYPEQSLEQSASSAALLKAWADLSYSGGIRAYSRSHVTDGGTPGYYLYAITEAGIPFGKDLVRRVMHDFVSATGCVWELQSVSDPNWGLEKRRLWDSAVLLLGLVHYAGRTTPDLPVSAIMGDYRPTQVSGLLSRAGKEYSGKFVVLGENAASHVRELASQLARHLGTPVDVGAWSGTLPREGNTVLIAPAPPAMLSEWEPGLTGLGGTYQSATLPGRVVIWVRSTGNVFSDLRGIEHDLFRSAIPRRKPAPFPDSDIELANQIGETPSGAVPVKVTCAQPISISIGGKNIQGTSTAVPLALGASGGAGTISVGAALENKVVALNVSAHGGPAALARVEVTFPVGYWVVEARNLQGTWNRMSNPIDEIHNPDGTRTFIFQVHLGPRVSQSFMLRLARPAIVEKN